MPKPRPIKRATIVDVAAKAGVSLGTASRVMNNRRDVDPDLRRKVMEAARLLHYVRTQRGRRAARESLPIISFVLSNREFLHPMHARMLQGAEQYCEERGYFVVFKRFDYAPETPARQIKLPSLLREHGIADSLILAGTNYPNLIDATAAAGVPYVLYGNNMVGYARLPRTDLARSDDRTGCMEAVRYLIKLGHKQICYIGDISQPWFSNRYQAYLAAVEEAGLDPMAQTVRLSADNFQSGFNSAEAILRQGLRPTAIFCGSDHIALGVWEQLRRSGVRVPQDCSLVGFDDIPDAEVTNPPLTTVHNPFLEVGRELARLAVEKAKSPCASVPEAVLPTELVMRGTTWPCLEPRAAG
ncbi:MAG TPA: LacI family DNA-binding transcriptional regulator [Verrucomicrobiae bacterium]|nr:LacI family DNA-binding transcriptional regulator [Verrucomicrobiae bacterium]